MPTPIKKTADSLYAGLTGRNKTEFRKVNENRKKAWCCYYAAVTGLMETFVHIDESVLKEILKKSELSCSICRCNIIDDIIITNCKHIYHKKCLQLWENNNDTCPLCRNELGEPFFESELK